MDQDLKVALAEEFALKIISLEKNLRESKKEYRISDQLFRAGTSIGANIAESVYAESKTDFIHKLKISQKEANETLYWLRILYKSGYISKEQFESMSEDAEKLIRILSSVIITARKSLHP